MQIAYLVVTLFLGIVLSLSWSSRGWSNLAIKSGLVCWTLWSAVMMMANLAPLIMSGNMRLI